MTKSTTNLDVLVIGGGIAGLAAANRAAERGLCVAVLEKGEEENYPCNSRYSGGIIHVAFQNVKSPQLELLAAIQKATQGQADPMLSKALASTCGKAVDWLQDNGGRFLRVGNIDWQQWVLAPPRPLSPGLDWKGRGPDVTLRNLSALLAKRGGAVVRGTRVISLVERSGMCVGVEVVTGGVKKTYLSRSVVVADGGFQGNTELLREHVTPSPEKLKQRGAGTGAGDGLRMVLELGGHRTDLRFFYGHLLSRECFENERLWPYPQLDELGTAGIVVNTAGERFVDEGMGGVFVANAIAKLPDPLSTWAIFDRSIWEGPGRAARIPANPLLASAGGRMYNSDSLHELGALTGIGGKLRETIDNYNNALRDERLRDLPITRTSTQVVPMTIERAPFFAVPLCAGITYTFGGIVTDENGRVIRSDGSPIAGLYAVGATTGGLEGGLGGGYVGGLVKGLVFGLRAADHIAQGLINQAGGT